MAVLTKDGENVQGRGEKTNLPLAEYLTPRVKRLYDKDPVDQISHTAHCSMSITQNFNFLTSEFSKKELVEMCSYFIVLYLFESGPLAIDVDWTMENE